LVSVKQTVCHAGRRAAGLHGARGLSAEMLDLSRGIHARGARNADECAETNQRVLRIFESQAYF